MAISAAILGKRLQKARLKKGYTQEYIAEKIDLSVPHLSRIERGSSMLFPRISKISQQNSLPKQDTLFIKKDSAVINQDSLLLKDKINGKHQTKKSR